MDNPSPWLPIWISVVSAAIAVWAIVGQRLSSARDAEIQARLLSLETDKEAERRLLQKKASVVAFVVREPGIRKLFLRNIGDAVAEHVDVSIDGEPMRSSHWLRSDLPSDIRLSPQAETSFVLVSSISTPTHMRVRVTWSDASETDGLWESTL